MREKFPYIVALLAIAGSVFFALWNTTQSGRERQKLRANIYDLQQEVAKLKKSAEAAPQAAPKEETRISPVVTVASQTPPSEVRKGAPKAPVQEQPKARPQSESNDFAAVLSDIQEEVKEEARRSVPAETVTQQAENALAEGDQKGKIDMSDMDAIIRKAEQDLVAQYGEQILDREASAKAAEEARAAKAAEEAAQAEARAQAEAKAKAAAAAEAARHQAAAQAAAAARSEQKAPTMAETLAATSQEAPTASQTAPRASESAQTATDAPAAQEPSWKAAEGLPGSAPVAEVKSEAQAPRPVSTYGSARDKVTPVHGDDTASLQSVPATVSAAPSEPSWSAGAAAPARSSSLAPASQGTVSLKAKEQVERDIREENARRKAEAAPRRIERKNYNALGKRTMADILSEGM